MIFNITEGFDDMEYMLSCHDLRSEKKLTIKTSFTSYWNMAYIVIAYKRPLMTRALPIKEG